MSKITVHFVFERETKGAVRFMEVDENQTPVDMASGAKIGTLYLRKSALDGKTPKELTVTIDAR